MKKVLFAAIAVCGFTMVNAQLSNQLSGLGEQNASTSTSTLANAVTSQFNLKLEVRNIIRIIPNTNYDLSATFDHADELDNGLQLGSPIGSAIGLPGVGFIVSSNRNFHVDMTTPNSSVTGANVAAGSVGNNVMPISKFQYKATALSGGVTLASGAGSWSTLGTSQALATGGFGSDRYLGVEFKANPGWDYEGGNYTVPMTVTATQD